LNVEVAADVAGDLLGLDDRTLEVGVAATLQVDLLAADVGVDLGEVGAVRTPPCPCSRSRPA
jgi:hypothetical protein